MRMTSGIPSEKRKRVRDATASYAALAQLKGLSPEQAAQWVEDNVRDLASTRATLKILARAVVALARAVEVD